MIYITGDTHADFSRVHKVRDSILHLMRGEVFEIEGKTIFAFGGARSHDIQDGILNLDEEEKIYEYRKRGAYFRIRDYSWWDLELHTLLDTLEFHTQM